MFDPIYDGNSLCYIVMSNHAIANGMCLPTQSLLESRLYKSSLDYYIMNYMQHGTNNFSLSLLSSLSTKKLVHTLWRLAHYSPL
jgi:uncharacterized membrane protein YdcZ (DUF606 family)